MAIIKPEQLGSGSYSISGSFSGSFQGAHLGTSSYATNALSASYSSFALSASSAVSSSYSTNALSSSFAVSSSYSTNALSSSYTSTASFAVSSSYSSYALSASYTTNALSSSYALSSSFAQTASFLINNIDLSGSLRLYVSPSGSDTNNGTQPTSPFRTIKAAVSSLGAINPLISKRYTIFVGTGTYIEDNPIAVPPGVAIVGDNLRTVRLFASNPRKDYFHCQDSNYFYGLRFIDMQYPSFTFSFPCSTATGSVNSSGQVSSLSMVHSATGYTANQTNLDIGIIIESPNSISGSAASATATVNTDSTGSITAINLTNSGSGYVIGEKFHVSIPAPTAQQPFIAASPYVQNCSSITGPFTIDGQKIPVTTPLPYDINNILGSSVDSQGAGGGIRIDGNLVNSGSPLQSFVADAFTQVNQGGPGHLVINNGYSQFVSCFTTFCTYGFKVAAGGFANISNSVCDFGNFGIISKKNYPVAYNTASVATDKKSTVASLSLITGGNGYSSSIANTASLTITGGGGSGATAYGKIASGSFTEIILTSSGSGYISTPTLVFPTPTSGSNLTTATGSAVLSGVTEFLLTLVSGSRGVDISSNMFYSGSNYLVTGVATTIDPNQRRVTVFPAPPSIIAPNPVIFTQLSNISTGGLVLEYVGSGVTYNSLPKFGGIPNSGAEITEIAPGKAFYSTLDNIGNLKIGPYFGVNQLTGDVTISATNFTLAGISSIGPFRRNGANVGVVLNEVSNVTSLQNSLGTVGQDTVPTQYAVQQYLISQGLTSTNVFAGNSATATTASYALTASYIQNAVSASYALSSSYALSASQATSASYAVTASYVQTAQTASYVQTAQTASYVTGSIFTNGNRALTASYALTSSYVQNAVSASYATYATTAGNGGVTRILAGANVNLSPVDGLGDVTVTSFGTNLYNTATGSYGSFYDTGSVLAASATAVYSMSLSTTDISNGVFVSASSGDRTRVKFTNAGTYNLQFSSQFSNSDNANQDVVIWVRKNGSDIADSSGVATVPPFKAGSNGQTIAAWNYYLSLSAGDFIQMCWHVEQANIITLETIPAGVGPTHPRTPSTILTATRVDTFLSNTGSFSGSFTGTLTGTSSYATNALSASYAITASYALNGGSGGSFPYTGSAIITGSLTITGSLNVTGGITGSLQGTASYALTASFIDAGFY
jgi:hypothetical protein